MMNTVSTSKYSSFWNQILPIDGYVGTFRWEELGGDIVSRQWIRSSRERERDGEMERWRERSDSLNDYLRRNDELFDEATIVDVTDERNENDRLRLNWRRIM
jgi:hypothetical protein